MFSLELLTLKKKSKLARCWLAATLSDRQLKKTVGMKAIQSINIRETCEEILKFIFNDSANRGFRFSLYMSAQLMYGAVKLLKIQATLFQDSLYKIQIDLKPINLTPKTRRKNSEVLTIDEMLDDMTLIDPPPVTFEDANLREDLHLLPEINFEAIGDFMERDYVEDLDFGPLTEEQLDLLLNGGYFRMCLSPNRSNADGFDESAQQHRAAENTAEAQNMDISDRLAVAEETAAIDPSAQVLRTPQKRPSLTKDLDTPTKRLRLEQEQEINAASVDNIADREVDVAVRPIDECVGLPQEDPALPVEEAPALPAQESWELELPTAAPRTRRRRRVQRVDLCTQLSETSTGKSKASNINVYTTRCVRPVPERKRGMSAAALLVNPTTNRPLYRAADSSKWARELMWLYDSRITGPFVAENDTSMSADVIRLAEPEADLAELSMIREDTTRLEASHNKTAEPIPMDHDAIVEPMRTEDHYAIVEPMRTEDHDVIIEPMRTEVSEVPEVAEAPIALEMPEAPIAPEVPEDLPLAVITNTEDLNAFLPPKLRSKEKKTSFEKNPNADKVFIIDASESPVSTRSQESVGQSTWTKPELLVYLDILWGDRSVVMLQDLLPPETTRKADAAECFTLLLELFEDRQVVLKQTQSYGPIYITKVSAGSNSMDWDEA